jgi:hypothetical protein
LNRSFKQFNYEDQRGEIDVLVARQMSDTQSTAA